MYVHVCTPSIDDLELLGSKVPDSDYDIFQHYYSTLVKKLPIDDTELINLLKQHGLLPSHFQSVLMSRPTDADKTSYFLDYAIKPSVVAGIGNSFDRLLKVMEKFNKNLEVVECARTIRGRLPMKQRTEGGHQQGTCLIYI